MISVDEIIKMSEALDREDAITSKQYFLCFPKKMYKKLKKDGYKVEMHGNSAVVTL